MAEQTSQEHNSAKERALPLEEAPWLSLEKRGLVNILLLSHQRAFGTPLLAGDRTGSSRRLACQELFAVDMAVLAHDGAALDSNEGPRLTYANAAALRLWRHTWPTMIGMPSKLTAPANARRERAQALQTAQRRDAYQGYRGIRIDREGRRFMINNASIWTLWDEEGRACGQAAAFSDWWWL